VTDRTGFEVAVVAKHCALLRVSTREGFHIILILQCKC